MASYDDFDTVDMDGVQQAQELAIRKQRVFSPKQPGDYYCVILPPLVPKGQKALYYGTYRKHFSFRQLTRNNGAPYAMTCRQTLEQRCFACGVNEQIQSMLPNGDVNQAEETRRIGTRAKTRFVMNILEMHANGKVKGTTARILEYGPSVAGEIQSLFSKESGWGNVADPRNAMVLKLTYKSGFNASSLSSVSPTPHRLALPMDVDWAGTRTSFDEYIAEQIKSDTEMRRWFSVSSAQPMEESPSVRPSTALSGVGEVEGLVEGVDGEQTLPWDVEEASVAPSTAPSAVDLSDPAVAKAIAEIVARRKTTAAA